MKGARFHYQNLLKHGVMIIEAEEALNDGWSRRRRDGKSFEVLGKTGEGRFLQLVIEEHDDHIWVFHGRDMTDTERRRYRRK